MIRKGRTRPARHGAMTTVYDKRNIPRALIAADEFSDASNRTSSTVISSTQCHTHTHRFLSCRSRGVAWNGFDFKILFEAIACVSWPTLERPITGGEGGFITEHSVLQINARLMSLNSERETMRQPLHLLAVFTFRTLISITHKQILLVTKNLAPLPRICFSAVSSIIRLHGTKW